MELIALLTAVVGAAAIAARVCLMPTVDRTVAELEALSLLKKKPGIRRAVHFNY